MVIDTVALFDLDHTLIPFDSGMAWTRFLVGRGVLPAEAEDRYLAYCHQYVAGTLDMRAMQRNILQPLRHYPRALLAQWQNEFEAEMTSSVPASTLALVNRHQQAGHLCAIVTATSWLIAQPLARVFGIDQLLATVSGTVDGSPGGALTGEIDGEPCYQQHKLTRVRQWLASPPRGSKTGLADFTSSWFYSDSISDLPLLSAVSHPVAVRPDERLRAHALAAGWPILEPA